jgi:hypothetical protein
MKGDEALVARARAPLPRAFTVVSLGMVRIRLPQYADLRVMGTPHKTPSRMLAS